jgi:hypothetical protein
MVRQRMLIRAVSKIEVVDKSDNRSTQQPNQKSIAYSSQETHERHLGQYREDDEFRIKCQGTKESQSNLNRRYWGLNHPQCPEKASTNGILAKKPAQYLQCKRSFLGWTDHLVQCL